MGVLWLQWGRSLSTAETDPFDPLVVIRIDQLRFNGAAVFQLRKRRLSLIVISYIQDSSFNGAAVFQLRKQPDGRSSSLRVRLASFNRAAVFQLRKDD